jgi:homoserine kinase
MAVTLSLSVGPGEPGAVTRHPALDAFEAAGGQGPIAVESSIPPGRGLGFSGAARVAGAMAAAVQHGASLDDARTTALEIATALEGHADNVAPSVYGGLVATAGGRVVRVPIPRGPAVVAWIPAERTTSTRGARAALPDQVAFDDAVFNVGRVALLVAALATGDVDSLRTATEDRLHQDQRLARQPESRAAIDAALDTGAWCAWLSGSGPTIVALADPDDAERIGAALPPAGRTRTLAIDTAGAVVDDR